MRAHQTPHAILLHTAHEEVRDPQGVEEITGALFFLAVVLAQVQEVEDVRVPRLQVNGESSRTFVATLQNEQTNNKWRTGVNPIQRDLNTGLVAKWLSFHTPFKFQK